MDNNNTNARNAHLAALAAPVKAALAANDIAALADLNDCAINEIRDFCRAQGYNAAEFFNGECARIAGDRMSLNTYIFCKRTGSKFRATRSIRRSVWIAFKTRREIRA